MTSDTGGDPVPRGPGGRTPVLFALIFLVAFNLRPALTAVGPLLPRIGEEEGLSNALQGLLGALPLVAFAGASLVVHRISRRMGMERAILLALSLLAIGMVVRSYAGPVGLWAGAWIAGCAIAVGNVLVPALVRRDYPSRISVATGIYSACITLGAGTASALAVPLAGSIGWRGALAFWALPALVVAALWLPRAWPTPSYSVPSHSSGPASESVWRRRTSWYITAFMGLQSTSFFVMVTWLPTIEMEAGISAERAGLHLFGYQLVGVVAGLAIPWTMRRPDSQAAATLIASVPMVIGPLGLWLLPAWTVWWVAIAGAGAGASLVVALALISLRGRDQDGTTRLSGMAQSVGYLLAAAGPIAAGALADVTGGWNAGLAMLTMIGVVQLLISVPAGRDPVLNRS